MKKLLSLFKERSFPPLPHFHKREKKEEEEEEDSLPPKFRNVPAGYGGTFERTHADIPLIGTHGCESCLGVYFTIDKKRCFVAHICPRIEASDGGTGGLRVPDKLTYSQLKQQVRSRLEDAAAYDNWPAPSEAMRSSLVMACKLQATDSRVHADTVVGNCAAEAVTEWLCFPKGPKGHVLMKPLRHGGFVVGQTGDVEEYCDDEFDPRSREPVTVESVIRQPHVAHWAFSV
ncbi:hypothetical protein LTR36_008687 [Oleoguttula mirabilis]|uniref:Uncharacterized protein n=1 Tax=Oleoguttula mirabilis TaxID=1507867 RepID=A0AAV9JTQ9_9PEZI|nr:hypothetical protein LTR36_008687 [Oleoguttula mirabilis]